jgi:C1A family cysteine protease
MVVTDWFSPSYMKAYRGGIFAQRSADEVIPDPNHASVILGWGDNFWIVRNSFGQSFGMDGNIHIQMG